MSKDWKKVVLSLSQRPGWSQKAVASYLNVSQPTVAEWISGRRPVPPHFKIRLAGMAGWDRTALVLEDLLPDDIAQAWSDWNNRTTQQMGEKLEEKADEKEAKTKKKKKAASPK